MKKVILADRETEKMGIPRLLQGYAEIKLPENYYMTEDELVTHANYADAIITVFGKISSRVIESAEKLKIIAVAAAGYDNVDVSAATKKGIFVTRAATATVACVAEHAIALMIILSRKILEAVKHVKRGNWNFRNTPQAMGRQLEGKTIGITGIGRVGTELAKKAICLGMKVLAYDPYVSQTPIKGVKLTNLEQLLKQSDYVCVTAALTKETWHMIGEKELRMMKKSTFLINVARGGIVDETALYNALRKKWIAGAGLDVLESEPAKDKKLLKLKNCIVTPHIAGLTIERYRACGHVAVEEVKRVLNGGMPSLENLVNPEVLSIKK